MHAPAEYRVLLVTSSIVNGGLNVIGAAYACLPVLALANTALMFTSVRWWWATNNRNAFRIDRMAVVVAYLLHAVTIADRQSLTTAVEWGYQGCALVALSYYAAYVVEWYRLSFFVWFVFHCVQTASNIRQYRAFMPANERFR